MKQSDLIVKDLVLLGGGHSHAIVLKLFGMNSLPGVRLTLITPHSSTSYSGMLPGHVAGIYEFDQCHIDLRPLAQFAQAQLFVDRAIGLDLKNNRVICANRPDVAFDLLSIDIGSTPDRPSVAGALEHSIAIKPVPLFLSHWNQVVERVSQAPEQALCLGLIGGGAGGVELALAMQHRLHQLLKGAGQPLGNLEIHLFHRGAELMATTHNRWTRHRFQDILRQRGIKLHLQQTVIEIQDQAIVCASGLTVECDRVFWVTQASAASWLRQAGLATDAQGFVQVQETLQSVSHPQVFAAGDIATIVRHPRPKAGVFAVREGKPLFHNLQRALLGKPLKAFKPQQQYLSLISTGNQSAIASRGPLGFEAPLLWRWKDQIDQAFVAKFTNLPDMSEVAQRSGIWSIPSWLRPGYFLLTDQESSLSKTLIDPKATPEIAAARMRCGGCGSKVGSTILERVLRRIIEEQPADYHRHDILIGLEAPDDAAVVRVPAGQVMVHSLDYFRIMINDPFVFGQICANHSLSDIYAMGATPQTALAIATIPYSLEAQLAETLYQLLSGAMKVLRQSHTPLVGGHTTEGAELAFGLSCNGLAYPGQLLRKRGLQPGHVLILTKALGTGTLLAADMRLKAKGRWIDGAVQSMLQSNAAAASCLLNHQAAACTDVTGFGLLGHLVEMIKASSVAVELNLAAIPILEGAQETVQMDIVSSLQPQNLRACQSIHNLPESQNHPNFPLLFDPQTAGGLLAGIPESKANACLISLNHLGYGHSSVIGRVTNLAPGQQPILLV